MSLRARRLIQMATCLALACSLSAVAGDDDDDKPAVAGQVAPEAAALTIQQQHSVGIVVARPLEAKIPDSVDSQGVVLDTATLVSDFGEMTAAAIVERSMKAEVIRLQGLFADGAGASLKTLEAARAEEARAVAQAQSAAARFIQHWGPLASMPPANRRAFINAVARGRGLLLRADLPGRHSLGSMPDTAQLDVDGVRVPGRILGVMGQSDETQSVGLLIGIENAPAGLGPGVRVPIALMMAKRSGLLLPRDAVLYDERGAYVFEQLSDKSDREKTRYVRRNVTLLFGRGDGWLVDGVDDDDEIVVGGAGVLWSLEETAGRVVDDDDDD
jgi:hypothetical protein